MLVTSAAGPAGGPVNGRVEELRTALIDIAELAREGVHGCASAGVSLLHDGTVSTAAATSGQVLEVDTAQYDRGDGPCLTAMRINDVIAVDDFNADDRWPDVAAEARAADVYSSLSVPLREGDRAVGALNMYAQRPRAFNEESLHTARLIARQGAIALRYLQQAQLERVAREREHQIAEALQRSLLPTLPALDGVTLAARYLVATEAAQVGGDWYDAFPLPGDAIGVAIGDVMGHDVSAAAAMGQLRSVLRSYAYEGSSPGIVLDRMDRLVQAFGMANIATAIYARLVLDTAGAMMLFCNAGHLPPLLLHPDRRVQLLTGAAAHLIGAPVPTTRSRGEAAAALPAGSTLLLYTDGLIERPGTDLDTSIDNLARIVAAHNPTAGPDALCDRILQAIDQPGGDDVALLAIHISGTDIST